jgi:ParB family chromosome partitioning protein
MADVAIDQPDRAPAAEQTVPLDLLDPNPDQPRKRFAHDALHELADSIRTKGILQPLIVRRNPRSDNRFEIVAGERRWRAAQLAQLHEVPVIVRDLDDTEVLEVGIVENIQRADLSPMEEARAYRQLIDRFGHTQEQLATALGKSRSHIANSMRLLSLPEDVQSMVSEGTLSAGHARALITSSDPLALARKVVGKGLSVRETEKLARDANAPTKRQTKTAPEKDADTRALEQDLAANLRMGVSIEHKDVSGAGQITIRYANLDQLDLLCRLLSMPIDDQV